MADVAAISGAKSLVPRIEKIRKTIRSVDTRLFSLLLDLETLADMAESTREKSGTFDKSLSKSLKKSLADTIEGCLEFVNNTFMQVQELLDNSSNDDTTSSSTKHRLHKAKAIFSGARNATDTNLGLKTRVDVWIKDGTMLDAEEGIAMYKSSLSYKMTLVSLAITNRQLPLLSKISSTTLQKHFQRVPSTDTHLATRLSGMREMTAFPPESPKEVFKHVWNPMLDAIKAEVDAIRPQPGDSNAETQAKEAQAIGIEKRLDTLEETRVMLMAELDRKRT